jgi:hypothetical protein
MLSVIMLSVIVLNVTYKPFMLSAIMLNVTCMTFMPSVVMVNVIMLSVVAPTTEIICAAACVKPYPEILQLI